MNYLLVLYTGKQIQCTTLKKGDCITIGTGEKDTLRLEDYNLDVNHLTLSYIDGGINILSHTPFSMMGEKTMNMVISAGNTVNITEQLMLAVFVKHCECESVISLKKINEITVGRSSKNDICLKGSLVSSSHAVIKRDKGVWVVKDRHSHNGVFINGRLIDTEKTKLNDGAEIFIGGFILEFRDETLRFKNTQGESIFSPSIVREVLPNIKAKKPYPSFYRSPRIRKTASEAEVEILAPPNTGTKPSISWLLVLLPPCTMITVMLLIASFTRNIGTLFYTLPMSCVSIMMATINYRSQMKKWRELQTLAATKYQEHLTEKENEIAKAETAYMSVLSSINPGILECVSIAENIERRLWERTPNDSDFLNVRLGTGQAISNVHVKIPKEQLVLEENPFLKEATKLKARHETLSGIPICHSFLDAPIVGFEGNHDSVIKMVWTILINIATHHSYEDVKIVCIYPENEKDKWEWLRWLPHVWNKEKTRRFMSCTPEDKKKDTQQKDSPQKKKGQDKTARALLRELSETLKTRRREASDSKRDNIPETPFYILVFADKTLVENSGEQFLPESSKLGFAVLYAYDDIRTLPKECNAIIDCGDLGKAKIASIQMTAESETGNTFIPDSSYIHLNVADKFSRSLAPIHVQSSGRSGLIPSKALFLQGLGVTKVEEIDVLRRWRNSQSYSSLAVPIGFKGNSEIFEFDVRDGAMGPHGLVAGTTGSGKSEMLTTWLLSLAVHFSPEDVNFLLIEFKGNDLSNILRPLPHIAGIVSNLQDASSIERSLRSLRGEILRRERLFELAEGLPTKVIYEYQKYQKEHAKNLEPLPYLIVVVDEFAELKSQYPDKMDDFISIARVGRAPGLYMVLATQSPSGIVSGQVSANSKFRICLKTAEAGESKDMIGTPDAFHISLAGRAYVKVGNNEVYEQVQTFFTKATYHPEQSEQKNVPEINLVEINGERVSPEVYDKTTKASNDILSEGQAVVSYINNISEANNIHRAKQVWTETLPEVLDLSWLNEKYKTLAFQNDVWSNCNKGLSFIVGLLDNPEKQCQEPFILDLMKDGHQILYGAPSSGKTTFLQTAIFSAALSYLPNQLQFLILDFGSWSMKTFEELPHTLMVAYANNKEKLQQAEDYLLNELNTRKELFASHGVGTLEAYQQISGKQLPAIIVAIDNITVLNTQYSDMMDTIVKVASEGGGLGIYLLITCVGSSMFKLDNFIKSKHALELTDITEYRSIVGATSKQKPGHFPGRGFTKGPLEFQTALCVEGTNEGERIIRLREMCTAMKNAWSGERASINEAEAREINANELNFSSNSFQIGINKTSKQPVDFTFSEMSTCVISGKYDDSRSNILSLIINALSHEAEAKVYLYDKDEKISPLYPECITAHNASEADELISELADEFDRRSNDDDNENYRRIVFCIDDFLGFYRGISQESADILETLTRSGSDFNIYIYMVCSVDDLAFLNTFRNTVKPFDNCVKKGNAIVVGGNIRDYIAFNDLHNETDIKFSDNEGCIIHKGKVMSVKFARVSKE